MDSFSLSRLDYPEADEYQSADEAMEVLPDSESEGYELELESMTGKGINRLCSELLELKKASDEDFLKNIYSNYSAFLRIFEEFGAIESEIMKIKNHVSTQNMLVEELMNSFHSEILLDKLENLKEVCVEDLDLDFPSWMETRMQNILETLDILMSEQRMEEALVVLEKEFQTLQKLRKEKNSLLPIISSFAYAISDWRIRLAEQFASLAGHWRVTWPELHIALSGLCRLGESDRASVLLLNFFHLQLENSVNELKCSATFPYGTYTLELAKVVFSTISQAARSFVVLFGEASRYSSDLMQWARVELEVIYHSFDMYVKSISETSFDLGLAVETMNMSFSFCSLLEHERLSLRYDVINLMKPCITEVLRMHFDQLRKVVSLFSSTDNWVLGKFLISGKLSNEPTLLEINGKLEYLQLTSSGRKFITLMQLLLDVHFLMEIARVGGYFSDNLVVAALDLMAIMKGVPSTEEFHLNSEISEEGWASKAAKLAIKTLLEVEISETISKYNPTVDCLNKCTEDNPEGTQEGIDGSKLNEHVLGTGESRIRVDREFIHSIEDSKGLKTQIKIIQPLQNPVTDAIDFCQDDEGSSSPTIFNSCIEDEQASAGSDSISNRLSGTNSIDERKMDGYIVIYEEESGSDPDLDTTAALREICKWTGIGESESNSVEIQLLSVLEKLEPNGNLEHQDESVNVSILPVSDVENFAQVNGSLSDALTREAMPVLQTEGLISCTEVIEDSHLVATEENFQYDSCNGEDEMSRSEVQHSKEKIFPKENGQNDRTGVAEDDVNTCEVQHFDLKLLGSNDKDLCHERITNDERSGADPIAIATNNQWHLMETNGGTRDT